MSVNWADKTHNLLYVGVFALWADVSENGTFRVEFCFACKTQVTIGIGIQSLFDFVSSASDETEHQHGSEVAKAALQKLRTKFRPRKSHL